jgi:hypothetical protein
MASVLREITNEVHQKETIAPAKSIKSDWKGSHKFFDEEGNVEIVVKDAEAVETPQEQTPTTEESVEALNEEETEEEVAEEGEETEEDADLWKIREQKKVEWQGKHTFFKDEDEEIENEVVSKPQSAEVDQLEKDISKLSTA